MGLLNSVAAQGRNGDTRLAHVTPGEVVIPKEVAALRPDLVAHVSEQVRRMGGNPASLAVGRGRVNPQTGIEEFASDAEITAAYQATLGRAPDAAGLAYWQGQDLSGFKAAAAPEIASKIDSAYQTSFGRDAETAGKDYWTSQVNNGTLGSVGALNSAISGGAQGDDIRAQKDGAQYATAWRSEIDENKDPLSYNADLNKWNPLPIKKPVTPTASTSTPSVYTPLTQAVDPNGLVQNQMSSLLNHDSPYMQSARLRAMQSGQASGLLNSSLSATAGEKAATDAALQIATPDAATYTNQHLTNQAVTNEAGKFNTNWTNDFLKLQQQQTYALQSAGFGAELQGELQDKLNAFNAGQNQLNRDAVVNNANTAEGQKIVTDLATLSTDSAKYINDVLASDKFDAATKNVMINQAIAGYKGQQESLKGRALAINFNPGPYFNFDTLRPNETPTVVAPAAAQEADPRDGNYVGNPSSNN